MGNCLESEHEQPQGFSNHDSSSKQQPQPQQNYHTNYFDGQQSRYPQQSRNNSSVRQQSQFPSNYAVQHPNLQHQSGSDYSAVQQPQSQQQSRPSYSSMHTADLLDMIENRFKKTLIEIQTLKTNKKIDERTREKLCHIMREMEQKLCIFNCEMAGKEVEGNKLQQCFSEKRDLEKEVNHLNEAYNNCHKEYMILHERLNNASRNKSSRRTEPNKTTTKYMVSQAQIRENETVDTQSNTTREEKARYEELVKDLKNQLKKQEDTIKSLNVKIESYEDYRKQLKDRTAALEEEKRALSGLKDKVTEYKETARSLKVKVESTESYNRQLKESIATLEREKKALAEEKDSYVLRLSKIAGQRLVDDNPAIADLSDPNRPIKLGEMYSEIYDNEWTCALDALMNAGYNEEEAILTLRLTLLNILNYCKTKSDTLLKKTEDAVNFLFEEIKVLETKKTKQHLTMTKSQSKQFLKLTKDSLLDAQPDELINLPERWIPKINGQRNTAQSFETVKVKKPDGVGKRLTIFRKEVAESMVPIVQKAYMAASWEDGMFIPELKPFIKKCIFLGWMMVVQAPPMALVTCQEGQPLDKNMFKEYTKSGPEVDYLVWPALQLHERGPIIGKGIAQGRGKQMKQNKNNTQF